MQLYIVDIRSIGNCMLHEPKPSEQLDKNELLRPITVDVFLQRFRPWWPQHDASGVEEREFPWGKFPWKAPPDGMASIKDADVAEKAFKVLLTIHGSYEKYIETFSINATCMFPVR